MIDEEQLKSNISTVRERIRQAAEQSGRSFSDIMLVGAVKTMPSELIARAMPYLYAAGENRVNELEKNFEQDAYRGGKVHFIGHLQTNKVKKVAGRVELIQSVGSVHLAQCISDYMEKTGKVQDILIEVNIGREQSKSGVLPEQLDELVVKTACMSGVHIKGIMAIPPVCEKKSDSQIYFSKLYQLFIDIEGKKYDNVNMDILSMGMSCDYYEAILSGANMVRVGSAIFGKREAAI